MNNNNRGFATVIIILIVLLIAGYWFYVAEQKGLVVTNFVSCQRAGYRVTGAYLGRECLTPGGQIFTERYAATTAVNTYPNYQQASAITAYSNVSPAYNSYPTTAAYTVPAYSGPTGYVTFPIARSTGYSSSYGPTTFHTSSYSEPYTPPSYYPPTYSNQYYNK